MQAAFRAQNPCLFSRDGKFFRKENAYVFDFDPARTLTIFEKFANDLYADTATGSGTTDARKQRIRTLLNFFPVIGEDEAGQMCELDAERVLSIPRKIRSREVVRRGFMCDFLFQNIANVFRAPAEVLEVLQRLEPVKAPSEDMGRTRAVADDLDLDEQNEVDVPEEHVVGLAGDLFGEKVYAEVERDLSDVIEELTLTSERTPEDDLLDEFTEKFGATMADPLIDVAKQNYGTEMTRSQQKRTERKIKAEVDRTLNREVADFKIARNRIENERATALEDVETPEAEDEVNRKYNEQVQDALDELQQNLLGAREDMVKGAGETIVRDVETAKREAKKGALEDTFRDHLRGFSRTIPSFLMAYGDEIIDSTSSPLSVFDTTVPSQVFYEVTSISVDEFRLLRDGGDVNNPETGETEHFPGQLFDPVVFDDSVREFMDLRGQLANYFDESLEEDIFDYVPPQKTNQIFTPREVVVQMVDLFEQENPGCFDNPTHTFADLYMKSGLYITEIVKRLYRSAGMRSAIPGDRDRLRHILNYQVYGAAPTEIIYQIATNYILGFAKNADLMGEEFAGTGANDDGASTNNNGADSTVNANANNKNTDLIGAGDFVSANNNGDIANKNNFTSNFVLADTATLARVGSLAQFVDETFGAKLSKLEQMFDD